MARAENSVYGTFIRVLKKVGPKKIRRVHKSPEHRPGDLSQGVALTTSSPTAGRSGSLLMHWRLLTA